MEIKFNVIYLETNQGLGKTRQVALENTEYSLVAVMDSDDISVPERFELQMQKFCELPDAAVIGGQIIEFSAHSKIVGMRKVPETDEKIKKYMMRRCPFNHMTVMLKKEEVFRAGGYLDWHFNEDYYLWLRMRLKKCVFANIPVPLCYVRTGEQMYKRRGGVRYFRSEQRLQKFSLDHGIIGFPVYLENIILRFIIQMACPNRLRKFLYLFTRKPVGNSDIEVSGRQTEEKAEELPFSVVMSVYRGDSPEYFDKALKSVIEQTLRPAEIVLVVDGPIPREIENVIKKYKEILQEAKV